MPLQEFSSLPKKNVSYFSALAMALATPRACDHVTSKLPGENLGPVNYWKISTLVNNSELFPQP